MKLLKQLLFAAAFMICFSMTAAAQKQDDKKPVPKPTNPPVIVVQPKNVDKNKPKEDNKNDKKKPNGDFFSLSNKDGISFV